MLLGFPFHKTKIISRPYQIIAIYGDDYKFMTLLTYHDEIYYLSNILRMLWPMGLIVEVDIITTTLASCRDIYETVSYAYEFIHLKLSIKKTLSHERGHCVLCV